MDFLAEDNERAQKPALTVVRIGGRRMRLIRLVLMRYRLKLARYSLRASMCLAKIGRRLYRL